MDGTNEPFARFLIRNVHSGSRGQSLTSTATPAVRSALAQEWKDAQRKSPPPALHVERPLPDGTTAAIAPKT